MKNANVSVPVSAGNSPLATGEKQPEKNHLAREKNYIQYMTILLKSSINSCFPALRSQLNLSDLTALQITILS